MVDLGSTDFYIGIPSMPLREFEEYSTLLFDEWETHVVGALALPDFSLALEVEEGSVKAVGKIAAVLGALYIGIGQYGDFVSGLQTIRSQVSEAGDYLAKQAQTPFHSSGVAPVVRKRGGTLAHLQRLFVKVQRRELTVEQAMQEAQSFLGEEWAESPAFMEELHDSLLRAPLLPQQLQLRLDELEETPLLPGGTKERAPRPSRPAYLPPLQLRVEVWRESKKGKRRVRVTQL